MLEFLLSCLIGAARVVPRNVLTILVPLVAIVLLSACVAEMAPTMDPTDELMPSQAPTATYTPVPATTVTPEPTQASAATSEIVVKPTPEPTTVLKPTPEPSPALEIEADATIAGFWSDGSANVELTFSLQNKGGVGAEDRQTVGVTCLRGGEVINDCGSAMTILLPDGYGPGIGSMTTRLPPGDVSFALAYGGDGAEQLDFNVPERILGVDRDVWACFRDTPREVAFDDWEDWAEGAGCAGWFEKRILKWGQASPIRVSVDGPPGFVAQFRAILEELSPVLNLQFEWVDLATDAQIAAYVGLTIPEAYEQEVYCIQHEAFGCAELTKLDPLGKELKGQIVIYNLWPERGADHGDLDQWAKMQFRSAMIHEAVHVLAGMSHRTELLSIMNVNVHERAELSPMDEALLRLHGHNLIGSGMNMSEIERKIVFNDELLDPQTPDPRLVAWTLASQAYGELRNAGFVSFRVRTSSPGCSEGVGWADYTLGRPADDTPLFGWVRIDSQEEHVYSLQHRSSHREYWRQTGTEWTRANFRLFFEPLPGWNGDLSDPHHMLESILYYADWSDAETSIDTYGRAVLRVELDRVRLAADSRPESVEILLVVDDETHTIHEYSMDWKLDHPNCSSYKVEAIEGRYGVDFEFPKDIHLGSSVLNDCAEIDHLGSLNGYLRRSWHWPLECRLDKSVEERSRTYRFSLDGWSFTRFELVSDDFVNYSLYEVIGDATVEVDLEANGFSLGSYQGGYGVPAGSQLHWAHTPLAGGEYFIEVISHHPESPPSFTLVVVAQPTPPPPYRFKSISVWGWRSCGLLLDGTPLCWGKRIVEGNGSLVPGGKFTSISASGRHVCALRSDGTSECWDWKHDGEHTCSAKSE